MKEEPSKTLVRIADRLTGLAFEDMSTAERQICNILVIAEIGEFESDDWGNNTFVRKGKNESI